VKLIVCVHILHVCVGYMPFDPIPFDIFLRRFFRRSHRNFLSNLEGAVGSGADSEAIYNICLI
jgi:hypothetical protein